MLHSRGARRAAPPPPEPAETVPAPRYDLSTGSVDTALFPARSWGRIQRELLYQRPELLQRGEMQGDEALRVEIAKYLSAYRGVECTPEQIVVGAGIEYLLGCHCPSVCRRPGGGGNPGYSRTRAVLQNNALPCTLVDIDAEGLSAQALEASGANLCYLTPSHHFPTGVTMPAPRRAQILAWAAARPGRYILEDDYDSEFRFDTRPLPSLQGMAGPDGPVVLPDHLLQEPGPRHPHRLHGAAPQPAGPVTGGIFRSTPTRWAALSSRHWPPSWRAGISPAIWPGCVLSTSAAWKPLPRALRQALPGVTLGSVHSGLHISFDAAGRRWGRARPPWWRPAAREGVRLRGLREYYLARPESCPPDTVVAGYSALKEDDIPAVAAALARAWVP